MSPVDGRLSPVFEIYLEELLEWNKKFNLTAITDPAEIKIKHFEDSLSLLQIMPLANQSVIDIGAGAGFPGIPLKIECPEIKLTLLEATGKKVEFLRHITSKLGLSDVQVIKGRAEDLAGEQKEVFDIAVARAVADLRILAEYCLPFVKIHGFFIAYKEDQVDPEVKTAETAVDILGGKIKEIKKVKLPGSEIVRSLVVIEKVRPTPAKFPRRAGMAKKRPL